MAVLLEDGKDRFGALEIWDLSIVSHYKSEPVGAKVSFDKSETAVVKSEPDNSEPFEAKVSQAKVRQQISGGLGLQLVSLGCQK